ncbi:MAG: TlpA family protein disulfide reductase [Candidatus Jidaibacter sp.]|jgi:peroxiredoxin|nr:TlpA family protein disulfide reductase [Candidatus Jidaibacter sp.]
MEFSKKATFYSFSLTFVIFFSISCAAFLLCSNLAFSTQDTEEDIILLNPILSQKQKYQSLLRDQVEIENFVEPQLSLINSEGEAVALKNFRGKFIVMYFFATWCSSCSEELKQLDKLKNNANFLDVDDLIIMPVSEDYKDYTHVKSYYQNLKIKNLDFYLDAKKHAMASMGVKTVPTTILIDYKGNVFAKVDQNINWGKKEAFDDLMLLMEEKRDEKLNQKKQYDLKQDEGIIFNKDPSKKITIIN